ncbi:helix-turn-helix domain-containing protein [Streptomyces sp. MBT53]|uniref:helix-turn-helix domain-containing protein n=1 Tax=Streptomyces sp. MBT53 TaxID=1488384 RepID=UPI001911B3D6|nr:helix-turn-helix domain-containing protein [Streptomyces sp. MBT53]MBK6015610.1 helix-turn-helix domain-containing protein [Streptomyces sp. MBT53]
MGRPIDDDDREQVRRLHSQGKSRNEIAKTIERSPSTVSKIAAACDLTFDRAAEVETATRVRRADLAARRAELAVTLHDIAERELGRMTEPHLYFEWGGKDHTYAQKWQDEPTPADRRTMMATASAALDRSLKLAPPRDEAGERSRSVIGRLMEGLARNYADRHGSSPDGDDEK